MKNYILFVLICCWNNVIAQSNVTPILNLEQAVYYQGDNTAPLKHTNSYHLKVDPQKLPSLVRKFRPLPYWVFYVNFGDGTFATTENEVNIVHTYKEPGTYEIYIQATPVYTDSDDSIDERITVTVGNVLTSNKPNADWLINDCIDLTNERDGVPGETVTFIVGYKNNCFENAMDGTLSFSFRADEFEYELEDIEQHTHTGDSLIAINTVSENGVDKEVFTYSVSGLQVDKQRNFFIKLKVKESVWTGTRLGVFTTINFDENCSSCTEEASLSLKIGDSHDPSFKIMKLEAVEDDSLAYIVHLTNFFSNDGTASTDSIRLEDHYGNNLLIDSVIWTPLKTIRKEQAGIFNMDWDANIASFDFVPFYLRGMQEPNLHKIFTPEATYDGIEYKVYCRFPAGSSPSNQMICSTLNVFFDDHPAEIVRSCAFFPSEGYSYHNYQGKTADLLDSLLVLKPGASATLTPTMDSLPFVPNTYFWHPSGTINESLFIQPSTTTEYIFIAAKLDEYQQVLEYSADRILVEVKEVIQPSDIEVDVYAVSCAYGNDGVINIKLWGDETPYTVKWSDTGSTAPVRTGLLPGRYEVTITNALEADSVLNFTVSTPLALYANDDMTGDPYLSPSIMGGQPPYIVQWEDGSLGASYYYPEPGRCYGITVTDASSCYYITSVRKIYSVPALSDWLLILLTLLLLTYGSLILWQENQVLLSNNTKYIPLVGKLPFDEQIYLQTAKQFFFLPLLLLCCIAYFCSDFSVIDVAGILLSNAIILYWVHIFKMVQTTIVPKPKEEKG